MKILFELDNRIKTGYGLVCALRNIFKKKQSPKKAKKALHAWYKNIGRSHIRELIAVRDTIKENAEQMLKAAMQDEKETQERLQKAQQKHTQKHLQKQW